MDAWSIVEASALVLRTIMEAYRHEHGSCNVGNYPGGSKIDTCIITKDAESITIWCKITTQNPTPTSQYYYQQMPRGPDTVIRI